MSKPERSKRFRLASLLKFGAITLVIYVASFVPFFAIVCVVVPRDVIVPIPQPLRAMVTFYSPMLWVVGELQAVFYPSSAMPPPAPSPVNPPADTPAAPPDSP